MAKKTVQPTIQQKLRDELRQQEQRFEQRLDALIAQLQQERAIASDLRANLQAARARKEVIFIEAKALYERARQECERLRSVVAAKQEVIEILLPFYPHAVSPELHRQIALS